MCTAKKTTTQSQKNVLSSIRLGGEGELFLENEKIIFQSRFLK